MSTGSAADGDADGILGMVLLVIATWHDDPRPAWWDDVAAWAYRSCASPLHHVTAAHPTATAADGAPLRAFKLGSCWGGWDCNNPSYHSPAHFRAFRDFMLAIDNANAHTGVAPTAAALAPAWDALIEGTCHMCSYHCRVVRRRLALAI